MCQQHEILFVLRSFVYTIFVPPPDIYDQMVGITVLVLFGGDYGGGVGGEMKGGASLLENIPNLPFVDTQEKGNNTIKQL